MNKKELLDKVTQSFVELGNFLGYSIMKEESECQSSNIYLLDDNKKYSLQLEIEWRECDCFLYVVRMEDGKLPKDFYYANENGEWCRKYIEDIYVIKNPVYIEYVNLKGTGDFIERKFDFYNQLIQNNLQPLKDILE